VWADLVTLADRRLGWSSDYALLLRVGIESVRAHPLRYARGVAETVARQLLGPYRLQAPVAPTGAAPRVELRLRLAPVDPSTGLPGLTEGQPIPASNTWWGYSRPDGLIRTDWSNVARPRVVIGDAELERRYLDQFASMESLLHELPSRDGSSAVAAALNGLSRVYPPPALWLAVGVLGLVLARRPGLEALAALAATACVLVVGTALGVPAYREYRIPIDPLLLAFGVAGVAALVDRGRRYRQRA
jgi:hypothetical protein